MAAAASAASAAPDGVGGGGGGEACGGEMPLAFVPGILACAKDYEHLVPRCCRLVPVDFKPSVFLCNVQTPGEFGDFLGVMALRLLATALRLGLPDKEGGEPLPYAVAAHSAGGAALCQCLELLVRLQDGSAKDDLLEDAEPVLTRGDYAELKSALWALEGPPALPKAVISLEGSLLPCDAAGWAEEWSRAAKPPADSGWHPRCGWTWAMARLCAGSLAARCFSGMPLSSLRRWLRFPGSSGLLYIAGARSAGCNKQVLHAIRTLIATSPAPVQLVKVLGAGHNLTERPEVVSQAIAAAVQWTGARKAGEANAGAFRRLADVLADCAPRCICGFGRWAG